MLVNRIKIKPLSVNKAFMGRRFKTQDYKDYEQELFYLLPKLKVQKGKLKLEITAGLSSKNADIDNIAKIFIDVLQVKYDFNDKLIYKLILNKVDVKKGSEFIEFKIDNFKKI